MSFVINNLSCCDAQESDRKRAAVSTVSTPILERPWWSCAYPPFHEVLPVEDGYVFADCAPSSPSAWLEKNWERVVVEFGAVIERSVPIGTPLPNIAGIYFLIRDGAVVYVGLSKEMDARVAAHRRSGRNIERVWCMYGFADGMLRNVEALYIDAFRPVDNIHHRQRPFILERAFKRLRRKHA